MDYEEEIEEASGDEGSGVEGSGEEDEQLEWCEEGELPYDYEYDDDMVSFSM